MERSAIADRYYEAFRNTTDFGEVPMEDDLVFRGPSGEIKGAEAYRTVLAGLARGVKDLKVREQAVVGASVVTIYDFDLGAPGGPIPMAEVLRIPGSAIAAVELIFDSARLPG